MAKTIKTGQGPAVKQHNFFKEETEEQKSASFAQPYAPDQPVESFDARQTPIASPTTRIERRFSKTKEIDVDVFILSPSRVVRPIGLAKHPDIDPSDFVSLQHQHIYRTFDTEGRKQVYTSPVGGHFHVVELMPNPEDPSGVPVVKSVSGPMVMERKKKFGKTIQVPVPANDYDFHSHEVEYMGSNKVQSRQINIEAQKVIVSEAQKGAPPSGAYEA